MKYRKKLFIYFFGVFFLFTVVVIYVQYGIEKRAKVETLRSNMENYVDVISRYVNTYGIDSNSAIVGLMPENLRFTVVDKDGTVRFDNTLNSCQERHLENHLYRPEITEAAKDGEGTSVRYSDTKKIKYYYLAKEYGDYFVRAALPFDINVRNFLKTDYYFLTFILFLFVTALFTILYISDKFGKSVSGLKKFLDSVAANTPDFKNIKFPDTEIGEIGAGIVEAYRTINERNEALAAEREKIVQHINNSDEGVAIFTADRKVVYNNSRFLKYLNMITDDTTFSPESVFESPEFSMIGEMLSGKHDSDNPEMHVKISKGGNHYLVKLVVFVDGSFEIILSNISAEEQTRILKQEMTNNIAHELKTPVSVISGYLETITKLGENDTERRNFYIGRMAAQVARLSNLIRDVSIITKIEEASYMFDTDVVNVRDIIEDVVSDLTDKISEAEVKVVVDVPSDIKINGNYTLIYSIFRNLADNAIAYAGKGVEIGIVNYASDSHHHYFKFYDTGTGVPEEHLHRLFDRFYRVDKGRSRKNGGTGLGLAIVKHSVRLHGGEISVRNRKGGGLEFMFSLGIGTPKEN